MNVGAMERPVSIHVRELGTGPTVVLLHAFPCDGRMWMPQAEAIAASGRRALVVDLPGFGGSTLPVAEPSVDLVAELVVAELALRGVDRCVLAGVSLGGYVAMAILRAQPELVAALVLCDTKATADTDAAAANRERLAALVDAEPSAVGRILEQSVLPGLLGETTFATRPAVVDLVTGWIRDASAPTVAWYQRAMAHRPDSRAAMSALALPTLVVRGSEDALSSEEEADLMLATSGDASLARIEGVGHLANVEDPPAVAEAIVRFLALVTGPQTS